MMYDSVDCNFVGFTKSICLVLAFALPDDISIAGE